MSCQHPIIAVSLCLNPESKHVLKFISHQQLCNNSLLDLKNKYGANNVFCLPCGRCDTCRVDYSYDWSIRCKLESYYHKYNYFITLTYDDYHIKKASIKDFQMFIDRLQFYDPNCKYFCSTEFGDKTNRFHIHAILFTDYDFNLYDPVKMGSFLHFHSKFLDSQWRFGLHDICLFDKDCAAYVAKYTGKNTKCYMSRNLGKAYFVDHMLEILEDDFKLYVFCDGKNHQTINIPKCFVKWFQEVDISMLGYKERLLLNQKLRVLFNMSGANTIHEEDYLRARASSDLKKVKGGSYL